MLAKCTPQLHALRFKLIFSAEFCYFFSVSINFSNKELEKLVKISTTIRLFGHDGMHKRTGFPCLQTYQEKLSPYSVPPSKKNNPTQTRVDFFLEFRFMFQLFSNS